jgi:O-acetyl-ADP-ribose deacetylase (regulator of RNase III)
MQPGPLPQLILVDPNVALCAAWQEGFRDLPGVEIVNAFFERLETNWDCIVSAANSFGHMSGGVDLAIIQFFGEALMTRVQRRILNEWRGEQPVGTSMIIETGDSVHPYVAHTPTMRIPMAITNTDNVYLAMWAMLLAVQALDRPLIRVVACPGLGTATGRVPPDEAARQMALAYRHFLHPPARLDWKFAFARQEAIRFGGDPRLVPPPPRSSGGSGNMP